MASISWPKCGACRGIPAVCVGSKSKAGCLPAACLHAQWIMRGTATLQDTPVALYAEYSIAASQVQQGPKVDLAVLLGSPALLLHHVLPCSRTYRTTAATVSYTCFRVIAWCRSQSNSPPAAHALTMGSGCTDLHTHVIAVC
jgi:hypothetical protein